MAEQLALNQRVRGSSPWSPISHSIAPPGATKPQFKTEYERDGILRVTRVVNEYITANMSDATYNNLGSFTYSYDEVGNPLTETSGYFLAGRARADRVFTYDTLNRLTQAVLGDSFDMSPPGEDETTTYVYDDLGNRTSHSYRDATAISYTHDDANRMTSVAGLTQSYDDAGNQTTGYSADRSTAYAYKYDHHNRLSEIWDATETNRKAAFTYDALGRRIVYVNDVLAETIRYYYDGVNEIAEFDASGTLLRRYTHGISYVDERLMMYDASTDRPYYYTLDRMYDVRRVVDRAGAIVERYMYDPYGRPYVTEMIGRGDMNNNVAFQANDVSRFLNAQNGTIWDPRADMDDDGDVDQDDNDAFLAKYTLWGQNPPVVRQAFSDVGNPYMFQGRPHFALDTTAAATEATLMLNDHRARFCDPVIGRWLTRDPLDYQSCGEWVIHPFDSHTRMLVGRRSCPASAQATNAYVYLGLLPNDKQDPTGLGLCCGIKCSFSCHGCAKAATCLSDAGNFCGHSDRVTKCTDQCWQNGGDATQCDVDCHIAWEIGKGPAWKECMNDEKDKCSDRPDLNKCGSCIKCLYGCLYKNLLP